MEINCAHSSRLHVCVSVCVDRDLVMKILVRLNVYVLFRAGHLRSFGR